MFNQCNICKAIPFSSGLCFSHGSVEEIYCTEKLDIPAANQVHYYFINCRMSCRGGGSTLISITIKMTEICRWFLWMIGKFRQRDWGTVLAHKDGEQQRSVIGCWGGMKETYFLSEEKAEIKPWVEIKENLRKGNGETELFQRFLFCFVFLVCNW